MTGRSTRMVVALGGNALEDKALPPTAQSQAQVVTRTAGLLADLSCAGYEMAVVHGNGPQVGRILLASETAAQVTPPMPFDVCGAMSQGYIGYHLQQKLREALLARGRDIPVVTVVTQVAVDPKDPAFADPTKPIGPFYDRETAEQLQKEQGYTMAEDAGRGYRRVVASPRPMEILEIGTLRTLWDTTIAIACGGGGVPVVRDQDGTHGVPAVIDKDLAASLLAQQMDADLLLILTEVDAVSIDFRKPTERQLGRVSVEELEQYCQQGQFAPGSMLPKVRAAMEFVEKNPQGQAVITSLSRGLDALHGKCGTWVAAK
jgi:carbamate kinase